MAIRIARLGSERLADEGLRIGAVRRPPRGVPKAEYSARDIYDAWFPTLAPSEELLKAFAPIDPKDWKTFSRRYRKEMKAPDARHAIALLAALSQQTHFSVGCYCADETLCHRSILRELLEAQGAVFREQSMA